MTTLYGRQRVRRGIAKEAITYVVLVGIIAVSVYWLGVGW